MKRRYICPFAVMGCLIAAAFTSCGIYGKYHQAEQLPVEGNIFGDAPLSDTAACMGLLQWEQVFTDPALQSLINEVLTDNYDLRIAGEHVRQSEAALLGAKLSYLPSVGLAPGIGYWGDKSQGLPYQLIAQASWEIDIFGRTLNSVRRSKAAAAQVRDYEQATRTALIAGTANAYYALLMLDEQLAVAIQTDSAWAKTVNVIHHLKEAGMANEAGAAQMEATYYAIQTTQRDLRQAIRETENAICLLRGKPSGTPVVRGSFTAQQMPDELTIGLPLQILHNRPDIRAAERNLEQAFYATNYARADFLPSLSLSAVIGYGNFNNGMLFPAQMLYNLAASLFVPIFQSGRHIAQLKMAKSQQEEALLAFCQATLAAGNEVNNALAEYHSEKEKVGLYEKQVEALSRATQATSKLMQYGSATYLEVLTAQNNYLAAQLSLIATRAQQMQALITLYQALGGDN